MFGKKYHWVYGITPEGKGVIAGPFSDRLQAMQAEDSLDRAQTFQLSTRDQSKATRQIKAAIFKQTGNIDRALERKSHRTVTTTPVDDMFEGDPFNENSRQY